MSIFYGKNFKPGVDTKTIEAITETMNRRKAVAMFEAGGNISDGGNTGLAIAHRFSSNAIDDADMFAKAVRSSGNGPGDDGVEDEGEDANEETGDEGETTDPDLKSKYTASPFTNNASAASLKPEEMVVGYLHIREMGGKSDKKSLRRFNQYGYVGALQFGVSALESVGELLPGSSKARDTAGVSQKEWIMDGAHWVGGDTARDAWLSSWSRQRASGIKLAAKNYESLRYVLDEKGITDKTEIAALLAAAHLGGAGSVKKALRGGDVRKDGNGTSIWNYREGFKSWWAEKYGPTINPSLQLLPRSEAGGDKSLEPERDSGFRPSKVTA